MQIQCEKCSQLITFEDSAPKFCSECGADLSGSVASASPISRDDATIAASLPSTDTDSLAATVPPTDGTQPISPEHAAKFNLETVGPYRLLGKLGQGGMGTVYEAVHMETGRHVALKLLMASFRGTDEMVQRFKRESEIAASINHPRSTFVYESGEHDGQLYITMELMSGGTLRDVVEKEGPLPVAKAVDYLIDIVDGLLVAHDAGIVHRDLKPSNSFVDTDGRIKVGDFGLAKSFLADSSLTQTGTFMGTPQYAAPEQIRNENIDERTDIYALGGTLFYLLSGRAPFVGNAAQVITSIATDVPSRVSEFAKNVPKPLTNLIAQTLEKDPNRRPFNLNVVRDTLLQFSTRGAMVADPGRRMAAFFTDILIAALITGILSMFLSTALLLALSMMRIDVNPQVLGIMIVFPVSIAYFAVLESRYGRTIGKWLFGMRVVNQQSESPRFSRSLLRALMIPGLSMTLGQISAYLLIDQNNIANFGDVVEMIFKSQASSVFAWLAYIPMIITARRENGYQCLQGIVSGTKVVRLAGDLESRLLDQCGVTVPTKTDTATPIGDFEILGQFKSSSSGESTYLAKDKNLNRPIWVFDGFPDDPICEDRRNLSRPSRLRVISHACQGDRYWYATESAPGIPLIDTFGQRVTDWQSLCPLIRDVAYELMQSEENELLPASVRPGQVWLDHTGGVRLLDHALVEDPREQDSTEIIESLLATFMSTNDHPVELTTLHSELKNRQDDSTKYRWLVNRLNDMLEKPSSWNPLDRIGMTAISVSVEYVIIMSTILLAYFAIVETNLSAISQTVFSWCAGCLIVGIMGYFFHGGLAIRISKISVRRSRDKSEASRLRAAIRAIFGWLPWITLLTMTMFLIFHANESKAELTQQFDLTQSPVGPLIAIGSLPLMALFGIGLILAIANPARGIQDFVTGTRLMRK